GIVQIDRDGGLLLARAVLEDGTLGHVDEPIVETDPEIEVIGKVTANNPVLKLTCETTGNAGGSGKGSCRATGFRIGHGASVWRRERARPISERAHTGACRGGSCGRHGPG